MSHEDDELAALLRGKNANDKLESDMDIQDSIEEFISKFLSAVRSGLSSLLFALHKDTSMHVSFVILGHFIESFQWLAFAVYDEAQFTWNSSWTSWLVHSSTWAANFMGQSIRGFYGAIAFVAMIPLLCSLLVFGHRYLRWIWPLTVFRVWLQVSASVLFFPVCHSLFRMLFGCLGHTDFHAYHPSLHCNSWEAHLYMALAGILGALFLGSTLIFALCVFEMNPNQRIDHGDKISPNARAHARGNFAELIFRAALAIAFAVFVQFNEHRWPLAFSLFLVGCFLGALQFLYMPYYSRHIQALGLFQAVTPAWAGFCVLISNMRTDFGTGPIQVLLFGLPVILAMSFLVVQARVNQVLLWSVDRLTNPYYVELRARLSLQQVRKLHGLEENWLENLSDEVITAERQAFIEVEKMYELGVKRFPKSGLLHLHFASYYLYYRKNCPLAYRELTIIEGLDSSELDVNFFVHLHRLRAEFQSSRESSTQAQDVRNYIMFREGKRIADAASRLAARSLFDLWSEFLRGTPKVERVTRLGYVGRQAIAIAQTNYQKLLEINHTSVPVLRAYGGFVLDFLGNLSSSSQMLHKADEYEDMRANISTNDVTVVKFNTEQKNTLDIFDERNAVLSLSINQDEFCSILSVNTSCRDVFGYATTMDMVGKNINILVPDPISLIHNRIVSEFLSRNTSTLLNSTRLVIAVHRTGAIIPINLNVRWADNANSKLIGVMAPVKADDDQIMFDTETQCITYVTKNLYSMMGIRRESIAANEVHIGNVFPHFATSRAQTARERRLRDALLARARSPTGLIIPALNVIDGTMFLTRVWMYSMNIHGVYPSFMRVTRKVDADGLRSDANILDFSMEEVNGQGVLAHGVDEMFAKMANRTLRVDSHIRVTETSGSEGVGEEGSETPTTRNVQEESLYDVMEAVAPPPTARTEYFAKEKDISQQSMDRHATAVGIPTSAASVISEPVISGGHRVIHATAAPTRSPALSQRSVLPQTSRTLYAQEIALSPRSSAHHEASHRSVKADNDRSPQASARMSLAPSAGQSSASTHSKAEQRLAQSLKMSIGGFADKKKHKSRKGNEHSSSNHFEDPETSKTKQSPMAGLSALASSPGVRSSDKHSRRDAEIQRDSFGLGEASMAYEQDSQHTASSTGGSDIYSNDNGTTSNKVIAGFVKEQVEVSRRSMVRLQRGAWITLILIVGIWLVLLLLTDNNYSHSDTAMHTFILAAHRRLVAQGLLNAVSGLGLLRRGFYPGSELADRTAEVSFKAEALKYLEERLYNTEWLPSSARDYFYVPSIQFEFMVGNVHYQRTYNLKEMSESYIAYARNVATTTDPAAFDLDNQFYYAVVRNGEGVVAGAFERAEGYFKAALDTVFRNLWVAQSLCFIFSALVMVLFAVFELAPQLKQREENRQEMILLFFSLPRTVLKSLQRRYLQAMRNQGAEEDEDAPQKVIHDLQEDAGSDNGTESFSDSGETDGSVTESDTGYDGKLTTHETLHRVGYAGSELGHNILSDPAHDSLLGTEGRLARFKVSAGRRKNLTETVKTERRVLGIKFSVVLVIFTIFVVVHVVYILESHGMSQIYVKDAHAACLRKLHLQLSFYHVRESLTGHEASRPLAIASLANAQQYTQAVAYGSDVLDVHGQENFNDAQLNLHFEDACQSSYPETQLMSPAVISRYLTQCKAYLPHQNGLQDVLSSAIYIGKTLVSDGFENALTDGLADVMVPVPYPAGSPQHTEAKELFDSYSTLVEGIADPALFLSLELLYETARETSQSYASKHSYVFIGCAISLVLYFVTILNPVFTSLHDLTRHAVSLLLAVPPDVVMKIPQISRFIQDATRIHTDVKD